MHQLVAPALEVYTGAVRVQITFKSITHAVREKWQFFTLDLKDERLCVEANLGSDGLLFILNWNNRAERDGKKRISSFLERRRESA